MRPLNGRVLVLSLTAVKTRLKPGKLAGAFSSAAGKR